MNIQRLRTLENALRNIRTVPLALPPGKERRKFHFDFSAWIQLEPTCETKACAMGLAALLPEFQTQGLTAEIPSYSDFSMVFRLHGLEESPLVAAEKFFDIPNELAHCLFIRGSDSQYSRKESAKGVADAIAVVCAMEEAALSGKDTNRALTT